MSRQLGHIKRRRNIARRQRRATVRRINRNQAAMKHLTKPIEIPEGTRRRTYCCPICGTPINQWCGCGYGPEHNDPTRFP